MCNAFECFSDSTVRSLHVVEGVGTPQPASGKIVRDGHVGIVYKSVPGASMPQSLMAQQNLPRVIQLPKQILLHLEVRCIM